MAVNRKLEIVISAKDQASAAIGKVEDSFGGLKSAGADLLRILGPLAAGLAVTEVIQAAVAWEGYENALKAVFGTQEAANSELEFTRRISNDLGLELDGATSAWVKFSAAAKAAGIDVETARATFEAVAKTGTVLRLNTEDINGTFVALSQIASKGVVSMEELRQQLGERLPIALGQTAKAMGLTTGELIELVSSGKLLAEDFFPALTKGLNEFADPAIAESITSTAASINRFKTSVFELQLQVADAGLIDAFTGAINELGSTLSDERVATSLANLGETFSLIGGEAGTGFASVLNLGVKGLQALSVGARTSVAVLTAVGDRIGQIFASASLAVTGDFKLALDTINDTGVYERLEQNLASIEAEAKDLTGQNKDLAESTETVGEAAELTGDQLQEKFLKQIKEMQKAGESQSGFDAIGYGLVQVGEKAKEAGGEVSKTALELEKLASNERLKKLELSVSLKTATLEAQTERITSAFTSIDNTVSSTTGNISALFGQLSNAGSFGEKWAIEDQIEKENALRDQAAEQQRELIDLQIESQQIANRKAQAGGGAINISMDGVYPELEMIMWEIIKRVQIQVSESESNFLTVGP